MQLRRRFLTGWLAVAAAVFVMVSTVVGQVPTPTPTPTPTPSPTPEPGPSPNPSPSPSPTPVSAPTLIYRVEFKREGKPVNDPRPRFGYLFVDSSTGAVSSIVVLIDALSRRMYYTTGLLNGRYYEVSDEDGDREADVISASSGSPNSDFAALQLTSRERRTYSFSGGVVVGAAPNMRGWLLLSGADSANSGEGTVPAASPTPVPSPTPGVVELGYAAAAKADAKLQRTASRAFFRRGAGVSEISQFYVDSLKAMGVEAASAPNPGPAPEPSPTPVGFELAVP